MNRNVTIVTGLWDLGRDSLNDTFKRSFEEYKNKFYDILTVDIPMCVWIPKDLESYVMSIRGDKPTYIFNKELKDFETWNPFFNKIEEIRNNDSWKHKAAWLSESPQANLKYYNPMMFTKMFMVNDSAIINPFDSKYFFWIDGGITNTVHKGYFNHDNVFDNLENYVEDKFIQIAYPYENDNEIHGFDSREMAKYCKTDKVEYVCRGGFFGGYKDVVHTVNSLYYSIMNDTLSSGQMGADECLFTILSYTNPDVTETYKVEANGLVWPFFENLKMYKNTRRSSELGERPFAKLKTSLYVLTFNFPEQFERLCKSFKDSDEDFLGVPRKILVNNSTDRSTDSRYEYLCKQYGFEEIRKNNIGICGGRQFCAEHFQSSDSDYYIFFEDDMFLYPRNTNTHCINGLRNYIERLYYKSLKIIHNNNLDYLKLSFSEFFGDSVTQWAWYNIPQNVRSQYFPDKPNLPEMGLDPNPPKTIYKTIGREQDCTYIIGDVHYCNWPIWFSREGNKKVFLDVKWESPFEQTWMSYIFQEQKKGNINAAVLLASPINHTRDHFYKAEERREN
jgi:hypothetical protein